MIKLDADTGGLEAYPAVVGGILSAIASPNNIDHFTRDVGNNLKARIMADAIASSGLPSLRHMFEWPEQDARGVSTGESSQQPLFRVKVTGGRLSKAISYDILPSTQPVPLPDPERYGFKESKLDHMSRHVFRWKALVMETGQRVTVSPKPGNKLFIPTADAPRGYVMTARSVQINPGGSQATGGFVTFWNTWFESVGTRVVDSMTNIQEERVGRAARTVLRDKTTGRFTRGQRVNINYGGATFRTAEASMSAKLIRGKSEGTNGI